MEHEMFFEREERYIVIKRKYLTEESERDIRNMLGDKGIPLTTAVVVEEDWPEYNTVWEMLEERFLKSTTDKPESPNRGRPDYSPREIRLLKESNCLSSWVTNERKPRHVNVLGKSSVDPDVIVVRIEGDSKPYWVMACGNEAYDGNIIGTDIWIRES